VESDPAGTPAALPPPLTIEVQIERDGFIRVTITGQIDRFSTSEIGERLTEARTPMPDSDMIIDLSGVEFIDSSGLHLLLQTHQALHGAGATLVLIAPNEPVKGLLTLTGLDRYLTAVDTLSQALALVA
jgi:anti-sigma B factor antagonist